MQAGFDFRSIHLRVTAAEALRAADMIEYFPSDCSMYFLFHELEQRSSANGLIDRASFNRYFGGDRGATNNGTVAGGVAGIGKLFDLFDRHFSGSVDACEFSVGASILFVGSVEAKLKFAFQLLSNGNSHNQANYHSDIRTESDEDDGEEDDGEVSVSCRALWVIVRSYILVLFALFGHTIDVAVVDEHAVDVVATFRAQRSHFSTVPDDGCISLSEFVGWYCSNNSSNTNWFSLLDLRAWLQKHLMQGSNNQPSSSVSRSEFEADYCAYQLAFELRLLFGKQVTLHEFRTFLVGLPLSGIGIRYCMSVFDELQNNLHVLRDVLMEFHNARPSSSVVYVILCFALSVLCKGSKSAKFDFAFRLLSSCRDDNSRGTGTGDVIHALTKVELRMLLIAYIRGLFHLSNLYRDRRVGDNNPAVLTANFPSSVSVAASMADAVFERLGASEYITFDQFGKWYNSGGFEVAPWLEMINLDKWSKVQDKDPNKHLISELKAHRSSLAASNYDGDMPDFDEEEDSGEQEEGGEDEDDDDSDDEDDDGEEEEVSDETVAFVIPLYSGIVEPFAMGVPRSDALFLKVNALFEAFAGLQLESVTSAIKNAIGVDDDEGSGLVTSASLPTVVDALLVSVDGTAAPDEDLMYAYLFRFHSSMNCLLGSPVSTVNVDAIDGDEFGKKYRKYSNSLILLTNTIYVCIYRQQLEPAYSRREPSRRSLHMPLNCWTVISTTELADGTCFGCSAPCW
jgi:hypothetical protein